MYDLGDTANGKIMRAGEYNIIVTHQKNNTKEVLDPGDSKYGIKTRELSESLYTEILSLSPLSCLLPECQQPDGCLCLCQAGY